MAAPKENKNSEKWTEDKAKEFFKTAIEMAEKDSREFDFIGEIARELNSYKEIFNYLSNKFQSLKPLHNRLLTALEANCFYNAKKGNIVPSLGIINLKSNHGWTDRVDQTTKGEKVESNNIYLGNGINPEGD